MWYIYVAKIQKQLMITSIFSKSKPINYLFALVIATVAFVIAMLRYSQYSHDAIDVMPLMKHIGLFLVSYASLLLLSFMVIKNNLSKKNNYDVLFYSVFLLILPQSMLHTKVVLSNFFILLALRRLLSVRSQIDLKKKLFDSALWIAVAALFHPWALLFFPLIFVALVLHSDNRLRHWIIPFTGLAAVYILYLTYVSLQSGFWEKFLPFTLDADFDFTHYNTFQFIVSITILLSFGMWALLFYLVNITKKKRGVKPSFKTVAFAMLLALAIALVSPNKDGGEWLFLFAPLSIVMANYIESIKDHWFKEVFVGVLLLTPFIVLML